jgi:hypothetical protein
MKDAILAHINDPGQLEKIYRADRLRFKREFSNLYPELRGNMLADFWHERLTDENQEIAPARGGELITVLLIAAVAGCIAKLPAFFGWDEEIFYSRNIGFIIFPALMLYFGWNNKLQPRLAWAIGAAILVVLIYINQLPPNPNSDTIVLAGIHLPLFLWSLLGITFTGSISYHHQKWLDYLKYNGDLVVITTLIVISGFITSIITVGLFSIIGYEIGEFYFQNIALYLLPSAPILGTYLTQHNPQLVGKVSPVIARIFSPVVLVMVTIYLIAILYSSKDPYNDREFLLIFNVLLIGVMALIIFSLTESVGRTRSKAEITILFLLASVTIFVNGIALSAIIFRIAEWGITPNRLAVSGSNLLILVHLILVVTQLIRVLNHKTDLTSVSKSITRYLPMYCIWALIVIFVFPLIFGV